MYGYVDGPCLGNGSMFNILATGLQFASVEMVAEVGLGRLSTHTRSRYEARTKCHPWQQGAPGYNEDVYHRRAPRRFVCLPRAAYVG